MIGETHLFATRHFDNSGLMKCEHQPHYIMFACFAFLALFALFF